MNETLKQNRLLREQVDDRSFAYPPNEVTNISDHQKDVCFSNPGDGDCVTIFFSPSRMTIGLSCME